MSTVVTMMRGIGRGARAGVLIAALASCSGQPEGPQRLQLADLAEFAQRYDGQKVVTQGTVRSHDDPEHYWIEDTQVHRVAIEPASAVAEHVGKRVRVRGVFRYSRDKGRRIAAERTVVLSE